MASFSLFGNKGSSKELIISILGKTSALTVKQVYAEFGKVSSERISYQAIHKMLLSLESDGVVFNANKKFSLDPHWVSNLKRLSIDLESQLSKQTKNKLPKNFGLETELYFDDINEFCISMAKIFVQLAKSMEKKGNTAAFIHNSWFPLSFSFNDFSLLKKMTDATPGKIYVVVGNDTPFNQWVKRMYVEAGFFININSTAKFEKDFGAISQYYWEVEFSKETRQTIDKIYSRVSNLLDLFGLYTAFLVKKPPKVEIRVKIMRNPQMSRLAFEKISSYFPNKKEMLLDAPFGK